MNKISSLLAIVFVSFLSITVTLSQTADTTKKQVVLKGTEWVGLDDPEKHIVTYRFEPNGILAYYYDGHSYRNGTWKQTQDKLYWETNGKYSEFSGVIAGEIIDGQSLNIKGEKWITVIYKYNKPAGATKTVRPKTKPKTKKSSH